jgi:hypothetical protein
VLTTAVVVLSALPSVSTYCQHLSAGPRLILLLVCASPYRTCVNSWTTLSFSFKLQLQLCCRHLDASAVVSDGCLGMMAGNRELCTQDCLMKYCIH